MRCAATMVLAALFTAGCNALLGIPEPGLVEEGGADAGPDGDAGPGDAVTIVASSVFHQEDGSTTTEPAGLGEVRAYRPMGDGFSDPITGDWIAGDETRYVIHGIPQGEQYYLNVPGWYPGTPGLDGGYIVSQARLLDLSSDWWSRRAQVFGGEGTRMVFNLYGMIDWQAGDTLAVLAPNLSPYWLQNTSGVEVGATDVLGLTFNWSQLPLVWSSAGDTLRVQHLRQRVVEGAGTVESVVDQVVYDNLEQVGGVSTDLFASFSPVPSGGSVDLNWRASEFKAAVGITAEPREYYGNCTVRIDAVQKGSLPILTLYLDAETDYDPAAVEYGNPFPDTLEPIRILDVSYPIRYDFPGAPTGAYVDYSNRVVMTESLANASSDPRPLVHAPIDVRINGVLLDEEPPEVTASFSLNEPMLVTWQVHPDSLNQPSYYRLAIIELAYVKKGVYPATTVVAAETPSREFIVRPGLLRPDRNYFLVVASRYAPNAEDSAPWRNTLPWAEAQIATGLFTMSR